MNFSVCLTEHLFLGEKLISPTDLVSKDLERHIKLRERIDAILRNHYSYLTSFWNNKIFCFSIDDPNSSNVNITSTAICLLSISESPSVEDRFFRGLTTFTPNPRQKIAETLLNTEWASADLPSFNVYTTPMAIIALGRLDADFTHPKIVRGMEAILREFQDGVAQFPNFPQSAFLTFWAAEALRTYCSKSGVNTKLAEDCENALMKSLLWTKNEIFQQIGCVYSKDLEKFDPTQLAYSIVLYERHMGKLGPATRISRKTLEHATNLVLEAKLSEGLWPKPRPIFSTQTEGNLYPFTYQMVDILLSAGEQYAHLYLSHIDKLAYLVQWAEDNEKEFDFDGRTVKGWRSNLLPTQTDVPRSWSTAPVFSTMIKLRGLTTPLINEEILKEFETVRYYKPDKTKFERIKDSDVIILGDSISLQGILSQYIIEPCLGSKGAEAKVSALFFGPPGTAKTSYSEAMACALGWTFLKLQSADLLSWGYSNAYSRTKYIFDRLCHLENVVILSDEIEEFVRDRERGETESRLSTNVMLPLLDNLHKNKNILFIATTNRLDELMKQLLAQADLT